MLLDSWCVLGSTMDLLYLRVFPAQISGCHDGAGFAWRELDLVQPPAQRYFLFLDLRLLLWLCRPIGLTHFLSTAGTLPTTYRGLFILLVQFVFQAIEPYLQQVVFENPLANNEASNVLFSVANLPNADADIDSVTKSTDSGCIFLHSHCPRLQTPPKRAIKKAFKIQ